MHNGFVTVAQLISGAIRYEVPPFQREYEWDYQQWEGLWQDLGLLYDKRLRSEKHPKHFMGIVLLDPLAQKRLGGATRYSVIDGQQRLTTILLLLAAIRDANIDATGGSLSPEHQLYFVRDNNNVIEGPRLVAQESDQPNFEAMMTGGWRNWYRDQTSKRSLNQWSVQKCYVYFRLCIWKGVQSFVEDDLALPYYRSSQAAAEITAEQLWEENGHVGAGAGEELSLEILDDIVRTELELLELRLTDADEDAPTIFESINAKRTELQQWDFIRNLIFTRFDYHSARILFENEWKPVQAELKRVTYDGLRSDSRDAFIYDYLIARGEHAKQGSVSKNRGYEHLRERISREVPRHPSSNYEERLDVFVRTDLLSAARSWPVAVGFSTQPVGGGVRIPENAERVIDSIRKLSAGPAFPAVLHFVEAYCTRMLSDEELLDRLGVVETFLARSILAKRPLSPMRSIFMGLMDDVCIDLDLEVLKRALVGTPDSPGPMPTDDEVREHMIADDYYGSGTTGTQLGAIFRGIERFLAGPAANPLPYGRGDQDMSVEHIFPQSCAEPPHGEWASDFAKWKADPTALGQRLNRLGNLTLITNAANRRARARSFEVKRQVLAGLDTSSPHPILSVSSTVTECGQWTATEVDARTEWLIAKSLGAWPLPKTTSS